MDKKLTIDYHDSRRTLIELLRDRADGPIHLPPMNDTEERAYIIITALSVALFHICHIAQFDTKDALKGFEELCRDAHNNIHLICEGDLGDAPKH